MHVISTDWIVVPIHRGVVHAAPSANEGGSGKL